MAKKNKKNGKQQKAPHADDAGPLSRSDSIPARLDGAVAALGRARARKAAAAEAVSKAQLALEAAEAECAQLAKDVEALQSAMAAPPALPEVEPELLAVLFSACTAGSLARLEAALGARLGRAVCATVQYRWAWVRALREECGFATARSTHDADIGDTGCDIAPPVEILKRTFRLASASLPVDGGWYGIESSDLQACASMLGNLHAALPDKREIFDPETGNRWGCVERLMLSHFDVHGCFCDSSWSAIVRSFQDNAALRRGVPRSARSSSVLCRLGHGSKIDLALTVTPFKIRSTPPRWSPPEEGLFFDLDVDGFAAYWEKDAPERVLRQRRRDCLHVTCVIKCGLPAMERRSGRVLAYTPEHGVEDIGCRYLWHLAPYPNFGLRLSIDVECGGSGGFVIDEHVANAIWNRELPSGTDLAPLAWQSDNMFATCQLQTMKGMIALIRRGGGCGFAQKALAAQHAGAVGCIIYEAQGDREQMADVSSGMGTYFGGVEYPTPRIPCVLVGFEDGNRLLEAVLSPGGAHARINFGLSDEALRKPPESFCKFQQVASSGGAVHVAVLVESVTRPSGVNQNPCVDWFEAPAAAQRAFISENVSWVEVAAVNVNVV